MTRLHSQASERIIATVSAWPGVQTAPHRFGGIELRLGRRELGHLHGDHLADLPFTRQVRDQLIARGRAQPHHILPDSGWVSTSINTAADVQAAIDLFKLSYAHAQRATAKRHQPATDRPVS